MSSEKPGPTTSTGKEASALELDPQSQPDFRRKRRYTIGKSRQSADDSPIVDYGQCIKPAAEFSAPGPSVTITRSSSRHRRKSVTTGSIIDTQTEVECPDTGKANISVTSLGEATTSTASSPPANTRRGSRSRRSTRRYPPSSWKNNMGTDTVLTPLRGDGPLGPLDGQHSATRSADVPGHDARPAERSALGTNARSVDPEPSLNSRMVLKSPTTMVSSFVVKTASQPIPKGQYPHSEAAIQEARNDNIPHHPTASYSAPVLIRSRRRRLSDTSSYSKPTSSPEFRGHEQPSPSPLLSAAPQTKDLPLPDPEIAYAHTYHFTNCPHTSPPMSRPLNVQPILVQYHDDLLAYPPYHLRELQDESMARPPDIYIIEGSCSPCDSTSRREAESAILDTYAHNTDGLSDQLSRLKLDIESTSSLSLESVSTSTSSGPATNGTGTSSSSCSSKSKRSIGLSPGQILAIADIENQLNSMVKLRDRQVTSVWKGFTSRWGPATLGIHHDSDQDRGRRRTRDMSLSLNTDSNTEATTKTTTYTPENSVISHEKAQSRRRSVGRVRTSTVTSTTATSSRVTTTVTTSNNSSQTVSSMSSQQRTGRDRRTSTSSSNGPRERYSDGTRQVILSSSVDGVKSDGRMVVDWIRPELSAAGGRKRASNNSHSRNRGQKGMSIAKETQS
ncbi:hypothetical protein A1O1_09084 [Capronia coronata CBS 617.96]|uniref:Uncharacterized protein n=1 Tax=Capronia coronata CBS 617.96 TaxID=1182541 RepID=W9XDY2_9EURO|nr:uncharacterized protein A1O1_09084 [Capronia coronata CBS 617.96]EXJ78682.1 hypothetical protein A1O1_09084 [Capronia coronata CBS 617.96]